MEEKAKKKLTVKGLLKALLVVLLILVIIRCQRKDHCSVLHQSGRRRGFGL